MKKLLHLYDTYALKIGIAFLIIFTALYPKLPSVHIIRTWVYIRLEDFFILGIAIIWLVQLLRKKTKINIPVSIPIAVYWLVGLASLIFSLIFIAPNLLNFFPHVAALNYLRRIEYMILFLIALSSVRNLKDVRDYIIILSLTTLGVVIYGFGQRYYINLWSAFPAFFEKYSFCFPSFQTSNEEYAKGIPLCLQSGSRITSTFGGHYDLAAYLVLIIPILFNVSLGIKKIPLRVITLLLFLGSLILLIFTSSRISFIAYLFAIILALIFYKKKLFIIPVIIVSLILLVIFSASTAKRLMETARLSSVVTNMQGQLIGETTNNLPDELKNKIGRNEVIVQQPPPVQNLPKGSGYIGLPQQGERVSTNVAVVKKTLSPEEIRKLKITGGSIQISTISGNFVIRKVLVYDISFTTRFQSEWPNAWNAFLRNPLLGSGYSTITLASDNSYLRALGETGFLGLTTFLFIFLVLGITIKEINPVINRPLIKGFVYGIAGGTIGLMINAVLIDVFEASKVAENMWILLGIGTGALLLFKTKPVPYLKYLKKIFTSNLLIAIYIFIITFTVFLSSLNNFFVADDFTNLRLAASSSLGDILSFFTNSSNLFYHPVTKTITFFLFSLFSFSPQGYHVFNLFLHIIASVAVYFLALKFVKNKLLAFIASLIFIINPLNVESVFWSSSMPVTLSSIFLIFSLFHFFNFRERKSLFSYLLTFIFAIMAFFTYYLFLLLPILLIICDKLYFKQKNMWATVRTHLPFIILIPAYFLVLNLTHSSFNAPRLGLLYFISVFISILFVIIFDKISIFKTNKRNFKSKLLLLLLTTLILIFSSIVLVKQINEWRDAGNYTKNMLSVLRLEYENLQKSSNIFFIDPPEKNGNAWVLPTGLEDSLWFIYQDNNPHIYNTKSIADAKKIIINNNTKNNFIFEFQKDGDLKKVNN